MGFRLYAVDEAHNGHKNVMLQLATDSLPKVCRACETLAGPKPAPPAAAWEEEAVAQLPPRHHFTCMGMLRSFSGMPVLARLHACLAVVHKSNYACVIILIIVIPRFGLPFHAGLQLLPSRNDFEGTPGWPRRPTFQHVQLVSEARVTPKKASRSLSPEAQAAGNLLEGVK